MANLVYPGNLQWLAIAPETTYGVPAAAPVYWIPMDSPAWVPKITTLTDQSLDGSMATDRQQILGMRYDELTYSTYFYADSAFVHCQAMLGTPDVLTGSSDPYTHTTALYNGSGTNGAQPRSWTGWLYSGGQCVQFLGMQMVDLKASIKAESLPQFSVSWASMPAGFVTPPANTPGNVQPMAAWTAAISVGGTAITRYSDLEIDLKRGTKPIPTLTGTQSPMAIYAGEFSIAGTMQAVYQGTTDGDLAAYIANTQPAIVCTLNPPSDALHTLSFQMSKIAYDSVSPTGGGTDYMQNAIAFKALKNATDAVSGGLSPIKVTYKTAQSTSY